MERSDVKGPVLVVPAEGGRDTDAGCEDKELNGPPNGSGLLQAAAANMAT